MAVRERNIIRFRIILILSTIERFKAVTLEKRIRKRKKKGRRNRSKGNEKKGAGRRREEKHIVRNPGEPQTLHCRDPEHPIPHQKNLCAVSSPITKDLGKSSTPKCTETHTSHTLVFEKWNFSLLLLMI